MNKGERDELIVQIKLIALRDSNESFAGIKVHSVGFNGNEYHKLPSDFDLNSLNSISDLNLTTFAKNIGITKASGGAKADTYINGIGYSLKSTNSAPPALINHTVRPGFERVANLTNADISVLDKIVSNYWKLRCSNRIKEDIGNNNSLCPFLNYKEELRPILNYFLFKGTGAKDSKFIANYILSVDNPIDITTWTVYDESNALDLFWNKLVFSLRASKGMPNGYPNELSPKMKALKSSIDIWTKYSSGKYRGALHIRVKK